MSGGEHRALTREAAELVAEMLGLPVFSDGLITARYLLPICVPRSVPLSWSHSSGTCGTIPLSG